MYAEVKRLMIRIIMHVPLKPETQWLDFMNSNMRDIILRRPPTLTMPSSLPFKFRQNNAEPCNLNESNFYFLYCTNLPLTATFNSR